MFVDEAKRGRNEHMSVSAHIYEALLSFGWRCSIRSKRGGGEERGAEQSGDGDCVIHGSVPALGLPQKKTDQRSILVLCGGVLDRWMVLFKLPISEWKLVCLKSCTSA